MATNFLWGTRQAATTLLTTELNSLATANGSAASGAIDLTASGWQEGDLELFIASSSSAFTASSYCDVYFLPSTDGTNYPKYTSGSSWKLAMANYWVGTIAMHPATLSTETIYEGLTGVRIPAAKFKVVLVNNTGVTLPASGNTLKLYPTPEQY
jgi:hypothetical protein